MRGSLGAWVEGNYTLLGLGLGFRVLGLGSS